MAGNGNRLQDRLRTHLETNPRHINVRDLAYELKAKHGQIVYHLRELGYTPKRRSHRTGYGNPENSHHNPAPWTKAEP